MKPLDEEPAVASKPGVRIPSWLVPYASTVLNVAVFLLLGSLFVGDEIIKWQKGKFDYVEASFAIQTTVVLGFILLRRPAKGVDPDVRHQLVALMAFGSAALFVTEPRTENPSLLLAAKITMMVTNVLGLATVLNLGRSFGILIALRRVETRGLYSIIRHPMYFTDILLRVGLVLQVPHILNIVLALVSSGLYVKRALLEEAFLSKDPDYRAYMQRVRYRLVPFIF